LDADLECDVLGWQYISGSLPDGHELDRMDNPQVLLLSGYALVVVAKLQFSNK
jgi:hypothetical protein